METDMSDHAWIVENLATYVAGGLSPDERLRVDRHVTGCKECARELGEERGLDQVLQDLFADVRPAPGLESRMIQGLRSSSRGRQPMPRFLRFAACAAAVVVFGLVGAGAYQLDIAGKLPFPGQLAAADTGHIKADPSYFGPSAARTLDEALFAGRVALTDYSESMRRMPSAYPEASVDLAGKARGNMGVAFDSLKPPVSNLMHGSTHHGLNYASASMNDADGLAKGLKDRIDPNDLYNIAIRPSRGTGTMASNDLRRPDVDLRVINGEKAEPAEDKKEKGIDGDNGKFYPPALAIVVDGSARMHTSITNGTIGGKVKMPARQVPHPLGEQSAKADYKPTELAKLDPAKANVSFKDETAKVPPGADPAPAEKKPIHVGQVLLFQGEPKKTEPAPIGRKVIRSGEVEFEVESFEGFLGGIQKLIDGIPGGMVATVNSEKLTNGKVKGSVVVRVPPESLDKFLVSLRKDLAKLGELKSQRIGSQEVTKQYIDVDGRLRAARVMEERLLNLIKTGKGDVKDLVAAEDKLGATRAKIEEMEGEIRYLNNQVALSTLTITLAEREIQAAAALVLTESLGLRIEVDDVEKQQKAALAVIEKAKGRLTKSELKRYGGGQLEAVIFAEVAPERAGEVRKNLELLGAVTQHEAESLQKAVGGGTASGEIKTKKSDVQVQVVLYNTAKIEPREVHHLTIAARDVPASYKKLQEAVKGKGQVRDGKLQEQDKLNITAQFDFSVLADEKKALDLVIADAGHVLTRSTTQAAAGELVTDRKVGYRLTIKNVANIAPREKVTMDVAVKDVEQAVGQISDMVKASSGTVGPAGINLQTDGRLAATLRLDVPYAVKDDLIRKLKKAGSVRRQQSTPNAEAPEGDWALAHFTVTLVNDGPIVPSDDNLGAHIRTSLFYSFKLLSWSLSFIILGVCVLLPWALVLWVSFKLVRRMRTKPAAA